MREEVLRLLVVAAACGLTRPEVLTPPYFNLAEGRRVTATATCGEDVNEPELFCKLIGFNSDYLNQTDNLLIQGQVCDYCDSNRPEKKHPAEYAVDGAETWWQSPPLSRGSKYNEVNLTIDLGQEFHVAYVYVKMANSPRPGIWVLEKSVDNGVTYEPWQYFAESKADCERLFGAESALPLTQDTQVICETQYSKIVPLENGEIVVSLVKGRPSANDFFNSTLQEFTRATNVRFRFLRTKNLYGHLMAVERQDPSVTRRYFYSIKDISIGGRCRCNGHADTCDITDPNDSYKLLCRCQHNTCGHNCERCCPGFEQKAWSQSKANKLFVCEPCNCFGHSDHCVYNETIDLMRQSLDIHSNYEGGGVCQNCRDNTKGINCNECEDGFYRPHNYFWNQTDVCQPCQCQDHRYTGNCDEGSGKCQCGEAYLEPNCDACSYGYFGYPNCRPCECFLNGTRGYHCESLGGQCPCKQNYGGKLCRECSPGFYGFPDCLPCECNPLGSINSDVCEQASGNCSCSANFGGRTCDRCGDGYYDFPQCKYCQCDSRGTEAGVCNKATGVCLCKPGYGGPRCDQCLPEYNGYPDCRPCGCSEVGSASKVCDASGKCPCLFNFVGKTCEQCSPGYFKYPDCLPCECNRYGSNGVSCDNEGKCQCKPSFDGQHCEMCKPGLYNFPLCEDCNCNPAGILVTFKGCGSLPEGELCECKPRVTGRICDTCRPLYYNLQPYNTDGCQDCECNMAGVAGSIAECNPKSGQCVCKPSVTSRSCDTCAAGTYDLRQDNIFGCTDCGCDVGGSVTRACNKETGQCICQPRVTGRTCRGPLQTHYFPTLHQFLYEAEDGVTPSRTPVRYSFNEDLFPGYSWKGYAVFSPLQDEVIREDVYIQKPSVYRMVLRYVNLNDTVTMGQIKITPESQSDTEQTFVVAFKPSQTPAFITVSGPNNGIPSPLVMNPGQWSVSIKTTKYLFLDYFVLLPEAYYEAAILVDYVTTPCKIGQSGTCRFFSFPNVTSFDQVRGEGAYIVDGDSRVQFLDSYTVDGTEQGVTAQHKIPTLNNGQPTINLDLRITKPGAHVLLLNYVSPPGAPGSATVEVDARTQTNTTRGTAQLYPCDYSIVCRHVVLDKHGKVALFNFDSNFVSLVLKREGEASVAIDSIVAIPEEVWNFDYIKPKPVCVRKDRKCIQPTFYTLAEAKKIEFEEGHEHPATELPAHIFSNTTGLILLRGEDSMIDVAGKVPAPGPYQFVIHYYQPDYPEYNMDIILQNGQFYEAKLPLAHCPGTSGCRTQVRQADGNTIFNLKENFVLTLKTPSGKSVWLDYVLVMPADANMERTMEEEPIDQTAEFISQCGKDSYYIDEKTAGFCQDTVFSITTAYNDGALSCQCDYDGSMSFECAPFGGQCPCKPNVIGRKCEACRTGYYGFPDCRSCNCPSVSVCTTTGECVCPPMVVGELCDRCENFTYGYDPIIGCSECKCDPLGVENSLQCDIQTGSCECKTNVVGRTCDHCLSGHWYFPFCQPCDCDLRGTSDSICDQATAECFCKENVYGQACDLCKDGTFNIQEKNPDGCTKCFCFGKTTRCSSSTLYKDHINVIDGWTIKTGHVGKVVTLEDVSVNIEKPSEDSVGVDLTNYIFRNKTVFFSAPESYLGKRLTSYGGALNYSIFYTIGLFGSFIHGPDVILYGADTYLLHFSEEHPAPNEPFPASVELVESNFVLPNGLPTTREQLMQVLESVTGLYVRATYWEDGVTTRLMLVSLESASKKYNPVGGFAMSVEQCQCPAAYTGSSCEDCADGYYRADTGPYGGFCVPCQCNGHSNLCDKTTSVCLDCKHNTTGEHCESCEVGYHGNATTGTPYDCLICACPLPIPSNNFATSCELSEDGEEISCSCRPGYSGPRCESCASGLYGRPEQPGDYCKPCQCSGNIDPSDPNSCDTVTGDCLRCLHNTSGNLCQLCMPGTFGNATVRDCQSCVCDPCGTRECDDISGQCQCQKNVVGEKCDRCEANHYGFNGCQGCNACDCQLASESLQCDDISGQCRCKSGVTGRTCDRCTSGYWQYSAEGCVSCGCNTEYSIGFGCNPLTGQCECLPGVVGEKCDRCPPRWVLIEDQGCFECDTCHHALLDVTDALHQRLNPVQQEFETVAKSYFTTQRLNYLNETVNKLRPDVDVLNNNRINTSPAFNSIAEIESEARSLNRKAEYQVDAAKGSQGGKLKQDALEVEGLVLTSANGARETVREMEDIARSLEIGSGPQVDQALAWGNQILDQIRGVDLRSLKDEAEDGKVKASDLLGKTKEFGGPPDNMTEALEALRDRMASLDDRLNDLQKRQQEAQANADKTEVLNAKNRNSTLKSRANNVRYLNKDANLTLSDAKEYVQNASALLTSAKQAYAALPTEQENQINAKREVEEKTQHLNEELTAAEESVEKAKQHAEQLKQQAERLDNMLTDTRGSADSAIKAANAYADISVAIADAQKEAKEAVLASQNAIVKSGGMETMGNEVRTEKEELDNILRKAANEVFTQQSKNSPSTLQHIAKQNAYANSTYHDTKRMLENIPKLKVDGIYDDDSLDLVSDTATSALDQIKESVAQIPQQLQMVKQLHRDNQYAKTSVTAANKEVDKVVDILPNIKGLVRDLKKKPEELSELGTNLQKELDDLKNIISAARNLANEINVGATFFSNTTLELRNPDSISDQTLNSHVSLYFKTKNPNGLLLYLGNEVGTRSQMRRANSDDFMALQIENGYPVLTLDLGSKPEQIISKKFVADDNWHQAIIDRSGEKVKLTIKAQARRKDDPPEEFVDEHVMSGPSTLLNLDKDHSKLFVGGHSSNAIQPEVKEHPFEGRIEELVIGDTPVGLWNFEDADNLNTGSKQRDELIKSTTNTGYRFDGEGFVEIEKFIHKTRSIMQMEFKTKAEDGLLFVAFGKQSRSKRDSEGSHRVSIEIIGGKVVYQQYMGGDVVTLQSRRTYNDGQSHSVTVTREGAQATLMVDHALVSEYGGTGGGYTHLEVHKNIFFGGLPKSVTVEGIKGVALDGCIDRVEFDNTYHDLVLLNLNSKNVSPGCSPKFSRMISFEEGARGYALWPNATARDNVVQLVLKVKTTSPNGLIAYAVAGIASSASLQLVDGNIEFSSGGQTVSTSSSTKYNDGLWHVIVAKSKTNEPLLLEIDDFDSFKSPGTAVAIRLLYSNLYFGGVPSSVDAALAWKPQFSGCIGEATLNGVVINFANLSDTSNAIIGKCILNEEKPFGVAKDRNELPIKGEIDEVSKEEVEEIPDEPEEPELPVEVDRFEPDLPPTTTSSPPTPAPTPVPNCKLPLYPANDPSVSGSSGIRFGTKYDSRIEYAPLPGRLRNKYDISVNIKTLSTEGIILYVHDQKHIDFIALYLKDGKINYGFNCGSGAALLESSGPVNDGEWHNIRFSRVHTAGKLYIDRNQVAEGESRGSTKTINVNSTIYVGGIDPSISDNTKTNLKGLNNTFEGCLKELLINDKAMSSQAKPIGVIPCSTNVEIGAFFSPEGGYIKFSDRFRVGIEIDIKLEIKPRDLSGLLMSVHGKRDYLLLQMVNGTIRFSVDNGKGEIWAAYTPPTPHYFCDGQWHNIQAVKSKNVVSLSVDKVSVEPGIGVSSGTDTKHPLFVGGHPSKMRQLRGLLTTAQYVGCMRNLEINGGKHEPLNRLPAFGNVTQSICPTI